MSRTYHIFNADGHRVAEQHRDDDAIAPALLQGHVAKLVAIDGEQLARKSQHVLSADEPHPADDELETEAEFQARKAAEKAERDARRAAKAAADEVSENPPEPPPPPFEPAPEVTTEAPTPDNPA